MSPLTVETLLGLQLEVLRVRVDGAGRPEARIPLVDDRKEHFVEVDLG